MRSANEQLEGRLGRTCEEIRSSLLGATAHLEAYIDFPDEDIPAEIVDLVNEKVQLLKYFIIIFQFSLIQYFELIYYEFYHNQYLIY